MDGRSYRRQIERAFTALGFQRTSGRALERRAACVTTLVAVQPGFPRQWWVDVGFWVDAVAGGTPCPTRVEHAHLHYRLERLAPELREAIVAAGLLADADHLESLERFLGLVKGPLDERLRGLGSEAGLRRAYRDGELSNGMITWPAREWLEHSTGPEEARRAPT